MAMESLKVSAGSVKCCWLPASESVHSVEILSELFVGASSASVETCDPTMGLAIAAAVGSIVVKEWLCRPTQSWG